MSAPRHLASNSLLFTKFVTQSLWHEPFSSSQIETLLMLGPNFCNRWGEKKGAHTGGYKYIWKWAGYDKRHKICWSVGWLVCRSRSSRSQRQGIITRHMLLTLLWPKATCCNSVDRWDDGHKGFGSSTSSSDHHHSNQLWIGMRKDMGVINESSIKMPWAEGQRTNRDKSVLFLVFSKMVCPNDLILFPWGYCPSHTSFDE